MKIIAISDTHGLLPRIPKCDILIHCGDICPATDHNLDFQLSFLDRSFRRWLYFVKEGGVKNIIGVFGNHDFAAEEEANEVKKLKLPWICLEDSHETVEGLKIHGTAWTTNFFNWAFNAPEVDGELFLKQKFAHIPYNTDILISHGPPYGILDQTPRGTQIGSTALLEAIEQKQPKVCFFGHCHNGNEITNVVTVKGTRCYNCSLLNEKYEMTKKPVIVRYLTKTRAFV